MAIQLLATFAIQLLIVRMVGIGPETDAYIASQALPVVLFAIISSALQSVWLPKLSVLNNDFTQWRSQQSVAQSQALLLAGGFFLFIWITRKIWVIFLFPGFTDAQFNLIDRLTGPLLLAAGFNVQTSLLVIALRARNSFVIGEVITMLGTLLSLFLMIFLIPRYGVEGAAWITTLRAVLVFLILYWIAALPKISIRFWNGKIETWKQIRPILFGAAIYKTSPLIDRFWLSQASVGSITVFGLAQTAMGAVTTIMDRIITIPLTPTLARYVSENNYEGLKSAYSRGLTRVGFGVLVVFLLLLASYPIFPDLMKLMLDVSIETANTTWVLLFFLLGYLYGAISGSILVAVFYALDDMKTPMYVGVIGFLLGVVLKSLGFLFFGLYGLVVATSLYYLINSFYMMFRLERKIAFRLS